MAELQRSEGVSYLVITHDLSFVRHLCERVAVMYLGRIVETAETEQLFTEPHHPYTASLISATPNAAAKVGVRRERIVLTGEIPDPTAVPSGCRFRTRCPIGPLFSTERTICADVDPPLVQTPNGGLAACHFADEVPAFAASAERVAGTS
jgi:peptide/nickel transport system ATP-binding protein